MLSQVFIYKNSHSLESHLESCSVFFEKRNWGKIIVMTSVAIYVWAINTSNLVDDAAGVKTACLLCYLWWHSNYCNHDSCSERVGSKHPNLYKKKNNYNMPFSPIITSVHNNKKPYKSFFLPWAILDEAN